MPIYKITFITFGKAKKLEITSKHKLEAVKKFQKTTGGRNCKIKKIKRKA